MPRSEKTIELIKGIFAFPVPVLIVIPGVILHETNSFQFLWGLDFPLALVPLGAGLLLLTSGLCLAFITASLFFHVGEGTPAPWAPPKRFVVQGPYVYVRNPMLLSVLSMILGEAVLFGAWPLLIWGCVFWTLSTLYFIYFEEPELRRRFGNDYVEYVKHVRRWVPRRAPWKQHLPG